MCKNAEILILFLAEKKIWLEMEYEKFFARQPSLRHKSIILLEWGINWTRLQYAIRYGQVVKICTPNTISATGKLKFYACAKHMWPPVDRQLIWKLCNKKSWPCHAIGLSNKLRGDWPDSIR